MKLFDELSLNPRERREIAPGAIHLPDWLDLDQQRRLVGAWREWATDESRIPMGHTRLPSGATMSVQTVCLGWQWIPYRYVREVGGVPVSELPGWLTELARKAVADAYQDVAAAQSYRPDAALINYYDEHAKLGLHQDKDERSDAPVVSLSLGDGCVFRFGNTENRRAPYRDVELRSGDLFVFGGPARFAYHGVLRPVRAGTADPAIGLTSGRVNYTIRVTGLA